jgi:DNA-binding transcriptional MerR regulator
LFFFPSPSLLHTFTAETERVSRELKSAQLSLEKIRSIHDDEAKAAEAALKKLEDRIRETIAEREDAIAKLRAVQELNSELRVTIDKLRNQVGGRGGRA